MTLYVSGLMRHIIEELTTWTRTESTLYFTFKIVQTEGRRLGNSIERTRSRPKVSFTDHSYSGLPPGSRSGIGGGGGVGERRTRDREMLPSTPSVPRFRCLWFEIAGRFYRVCHQALTEHLAGSKQKLRLVCTPKLITALY